MVNMSLMPAYFTTTSTRKRKVKKTSRQLAAEKKHKKWLKKQGIQEKPSGRYREDFPSYIVNEKNLASTSDVIPTGIAVKQDPKQYNGERKLLGIATMHKSNMVPVFSQKDAEDIAKMRRN